MNTEAYLPFIISVIGTILAGLFAWVNSRPKAVTERFSTLIEGYAKLNENLQGEVKRLQHVVERQEIRIKELIATEERLEAKISTLIEECQKKI